MARPRKISQAQEREGYRMARGQRGWGPSPPRAPLLSSRPLLLKWGCAHVQRWERDAALSTSMSGDWTLPRPLEVGRAENGADRTVYRQRELPGFGKMLEYPLSVFNTIGWKFYSQGRVYPSIDLVCCGNIWKENHKLFDPDKLSVGNSLSVCRVNPQTQSSNLRAWVIFEY